MDLKKEFGRILTESSDLALATCVDGVPNVRIMNVCYDPAHPGSFFVSTDKGSPKTVEFEKNPKVAFMTYPGDPSKGSFYVRSNNAEIMPSTVPLDDLWDSFVEQVFMFEKVAKMKGDKMAIYEVKVHSAEVAPSMKERGTVTF